MMLFAGAKILYITDFRLSLSNSSLSVSYGDKNSSFWLIQLDSTHLREANTTIWFSNVLAVMIELFRCRVIGDWIRYDPICPASMLLVSLIIYPISFCGTSTILFLVSYLDENCKTFLVNWLGLSVFSFKNCWRLLVLLLSVLYVGLYMCIFQFHIITQWSVLHAQLELHQIISIAISVFSCENTFHWYFHV